MAITPAALLTITFKLVIHNKIFFIQLINWLLPNTVLWSIDISSSVLVWTVRSVQNKQLAIIRLLKT